MKSIILTNRGSDTGKIPSDVYTPRVSWAKTVQKRQVSTYSTKEIFRGITPNRLFPDAEPTSTRTKDTRKDTKKSLQITSHDNHDMKYNQDKQTQTNSFTNWKFSLTKNNSSTSSTDMDTTVSSSFRDSKEPLSELSSSQTDHIRSSLDTSIHLLDDILRKNNRDDDDTMLVETMSLPVMERNTMDELYHYQINRLKQDRNQLHQRCDMLRKKYDKMKVKASFLQNVNESLEANAEPIHRHVMDAQKCGNDIEQFLQGKHIPEPQDDGVSEVTMETMYY